MFRTVEAADAGAAVSVSLAGVAWFADLSALATLFASVAAIAAGVAAAMYHFEAWQQKRKGRK